MALLTSLLIPALFLGVPAHAEKIPDAEYKLKLDDYQIDIRDYQFPSGLRILFQAERSQPVVAITTVIDKGSEADPDGMEGIAHVVEHLAFRAKHGDLPKNWDLLQQLGAGINASTSNDWVDYMTVAPVDSLETVLRIEAKRLTDGVANVTAADVAAEREIARNELRMRYENAAIGEAWDSIAQQLFTPDWTYYRSTIGSHDSLDNITLEAVQNMVRDHYTPSNSTIVVVGDFDLDDSGAIINRVFGDFPELLQDPENPEAELELTVPKARVDCDNRAELPEPQPGEEVPRVKGMVDAETVVVGWSTPGGYCADEALAEFAANQLTNYIYLTLVPDWEWSNDEQSIEGLGCYAYPEQYASTVLCFIEPKAGGGYTGEKLAEKVADALYMQWDRQAISNPIYRGFTDYAYNSAKMSYMAWLLQNVDDVASLRGRATAGAHFTHYTGNPMVFSTTLNAINQVEPMAVQEFARKYLVRDRMVATIVEPMDEEDRARREAAAVRGEETREGYSGSTRDKEYDFVFDYDKLTPEAIREVTITPDRSKIKEVTLDNGLQVVIFPYGDAPLAHVQLKVFGSDQTSIPRELDGFSEAMSYRGHTHREKILAVAGFYGEGQGSRARVLESTGSSGNLDALLHQVRVKTTDVDWRIAAKNEKLKSWEKKYKKDGEEPEVWASRLQYQHMYGDHPLGVWMTPEEWDKMGEWDVNDVKRWLHTKYQPANAVLYVVGKIDGDAALESVKKYFGGWEADDSVTAGKESPMGKPTHVPDRIVMVFDKPIATQSAIMLTCQADWTDPQQDATAKVMSDVLDEQAWRILREESGVTYGAGAYASSWPGGANLVGLQSLVQNSAVGLAVETFFGLVKTMAEEGVDGKVAASHQWSRGRKFVLGHQSGSSMINRLSSPESIDYWDMFADALSQVDSTDFQPMIKPCVGHEVVTVVGPKEYAEAQLKERGIAYEVVDWESIHEATYTEKERKKRAKAKVKAEKKKAKEEKKKAKESASQ